MDDQAIVTPTSDKPWLFSKGNSEYARRKLRIAERVAALALEYNATGALAKQLLQIAATHLDAASMARSAQQQPAQPFYAPCSEGFRSA